jgi:hypothetical protein
LKKKGREVEDERGEEMGRYNGKKKEERR